MLYLLDTNVSVIYVNGWSVSVQNRILSVPTIEVYLR
jgi:hypothetical protein